MSAGDPSPGWHPDEVIARERQRNAETWEALVRLGVTEGNELELEFVYESGGSEGDHELADHLRGAHGYEAAVEAGGVTGTTTPIAVSPSLLDAWVTMMVIAGHEHGNCAFDGWTATVSAQG